MRQRGILREPPFSTPPLALWASVSNRKRPLAIWLCRDRTLPIGGNHWSVAGGLVILDYRRGQSHRSRNPACMNYESTAVRLSSPRIDGSLLRERTRINLSWLHKLRWAALAGQLVTIAVVHDWMQIEVPLDKLLAVLGLAAATNVALGFWLRSRWFANSSWAGRGEWISGSLMMLDNLFLTVLLYYTGGPSNPFTVFYLVNIAAGRGHSAGPLGVGSRRCGLPVFRISVRRACFLGRLGARTRPRTCHAPRHAHGAGPDEPALARQPDRVRRAPPRSSSTSLRGFPANWRSEKPSWMKPDNGNRKATSLTRWPRWPPGQRMS